MNFKTLRNILLVFALCIFLKCLFPSTYVLADDLGEDIPEIEIEAEAIGKNTFSGGGQGFTIINDNLMANAIVNRAVFLLNKQNGQAYEESLVRRSDHCNTLTYDTEKQYLIAADGTGELGADLYQVSDGVTKKITKVKHLNHAPGNGIGYDKVTGEFIGVGGHNIFAYKSENFYAGKSPYKTFRITYNSNYRTIQSAEAYGGNVYYVMTDGMDGRKIDGNTILVINIEQEKPIMRLHWSKAQEMEDCAFDSQGNLYFSTTSYYYKTNFNGNTISTETPMASAGSPAEFVISKIAGGINLLSDIIQIILESISTNQFVTKIKLTYSADEILNDSTLNKQIQLERDETFTNTNDVNNKEDNDEEQSEEVLTQDDNINIIPSTITNKAGIEKTVYNSQTAIPAITVSYDSIATDRLDFFDIEFLNTKNDNKNEIWRFFYTIVNLLSHIVLYISIALFITAIIYNGIVIVYFSVINPNPEPVKRAKGIMQNIIKGVLILVFIYLGMTLMLNFYKLVRDMLLSKFNNDSIYLMRQKVPGVYSFNTNYAGYMKYRSLTADAWDMLKWSAGRLIFTIVNVIATIVLLIRTMIIWFLTFIAPVTALTTVLGKNIAKNRGFLNVIYIRNFIVTYILSLWSPIVFIFILLIFS